MSFIYQIVKSKFFFVKKVIVTKKKIYQSERRDNKDLSKQNKKGRFRRGYNKLDT